jgi:hypothetical protein
MNAHLPNTNPTWRQSLRAIGLALGGLAPLVTGGVGIWHYLTQGNFIAKTGERIDGPSGLLMSGFFILAGLVMIGHAIRLYRCRTK